MQGRLDEPAREFANGVLAERHRKAMKRGRSFAKLSIDDRHRFRIGLKKLRYAADSFRSLYRSKATADYIKRLARLQDLLGHLTDLVIARRLRDELPHGADAGTATTIVCASGVLIGWHARSIAGLEPRLRKQRKAFKAAQPFWQEEAT
jgi:CHAD domain-containing protein